MADREDAELIVVGAGGRSTASASPLGTLSSTLMRQAPWPVVVVPSDAIPPLDAEGMRSVVCGVAGEETDTVLLQLADDLATRLGGELHAVHAYDPRPGRSAPPDRAREEALRDSAEHRLAVALEEAGLDTRRSILPMPAAEALGRVAEQQSAGLVVVAAKRRLLGSVAHGSVATQLAAQGRTAVVVLPLDARLAPGSGHYELITAPT